MNFAKTLVRGSMSLLSFMLISLAGLVAFHPARGVAQTYPTQPIRLVVPWPPGTPADVAGRLVAERMSVGLGQPVVVDNRPGAAGTIGLREVLRLPATGMWFICCRPHR